MTVRTSTSLKQAFKRFVDLVKPIQDVRHVVAYDEDDCDIYTYITKLDESVSNKVHEAELVIMCEFPQLPLLFHVRYLEGRPFNSNSASHLTSPETLPKRQGETTKLASEGQHLEQVRHNRQVAEHLAESRIYDWAVTALFYASLHMVTAYLVRIGMEPATHIQRERMMSSVTELTGIFGAYRTLRDLSEYARYDCGSFTQDEFEAIRSGTFSAIAEHLQTLMGGRP